MPRRTPHRLVPIVAERVRAAMYYAGLNSRSLFERATAGKAKARKKKRARPTGASIDFILSGKTKRTHRELRDAIARACGAPITSEFLGGEAELAIESLLWPPSGTRAAMEMPTDVNGQPRVGVLRETTPQYELEAVRLGRKLSASAKRDDSLEAIHPQPRLDNSARWLLSLSFWREFIHRGQSLGTQRSQFPDEADAFAFHLSQAVGILLRPWLAGRAELRPKMLYRLTNFLDAVASENVEMNMAIEGGRTADVAILDELGFWPPSLRATRREGLEQIRDQRRAAGMKEAAIARALTEWQRVSDDEIERMGDDDDLD